MSREMKNSELIFASKIPYFWEVRKMKDISNVITDYVASGSFKDLADNVKYLDSPDYAMLIRTADLSKKTNANERPVYIDKHSYDFLHNSNLYGGEIILPNVGTIGEAYIVENLYPKMSLAPNSIMLKTNYCDKYYYYYFNCDVGSLSLKSISEDAVQSKFNKTNFKLLKVIVPPLLDQQAIANFLDDKCSKIDSAIAKQKAIANKLEIYKRTLIIDCVFGRTLVEKKRIETEIDWVSELPLDWKTIPLKTLFVQRNNKNKDCIEKNLLSLSYGNIIKKNINSNNGLVPESYEGYNIIENGDIVLRLTDLQNDHKSLRTGLCTQHGIITSAYITLKPKNNVNSHYYRYVLHAYDLMKVFYTMGEGIRQSLTFDDIKKDIYVPLPSQKEQQQIVSYLDNKCSQIDEAITRSSAIIEKLEEYKKSIIYEYVTGKKEVK